MCSFGVKESEQSEGIKAILNSYLFVPVNVILSLTSLTGNILILIALQAVSSLHSSSKLLFRCLSFTDLFVGLFSQPIFVTYLMAIANKNRNLCAISEGLASISSALLCGESISTLTAISVDRLLALVLRLRYREVVTLTRVRLVRDNFLDQQHCICHDLFMEQEIFLSRILCMAFLMFRHLIMLLLENLCFSSPSSSSSTRFPGQSWSIHEHGAI